MTNDKINVTFQCKKCGGTVLELPDNSTDESVAKCKSCGIPFGTFGEIKSKAVAEAKDHVQNLLRNTMKNAGWKITKG